MQKRQGHIPLRRCAACGTRLPQKELVRIVRTLQGQVTTDLEGKKSGRGAYLCHSQECWERGLKKTRLNHVLRASVSAEDLRLLQEFAKGIIEQV